MTIKDVEISNEDIIKLDPLTILLLAAFVPIFIAELVVTLIYRKLSIYRIDARKPQ